MTEACTNVVLHAYPHITGGGLMVAVRLGDEALVVTVSDAGVGLRPRSDSPGLGRGLELIEALSDTLQIRDRDPGAEVRMTFHLAPNR